jgi:hypothetical protein
MSRIRAAGVLAAGLLCLLPAGASAAPVTVDLRVEGRTRTLFEGKVTTDVRTFRFTDGPATAPCDGTGPNGSTTTPSPTRGAALATAAEQYGFALTGRFFEFGPSFATVAGEDVSYDAATGAYLAEYENGVAPSVGACNDPVVDGDEVLFAWGTGSEPVLRLTAPATAAPGSPVTVRVTDAASGAPIAGARVDGAVTGADGSAAVTFAARGPAVLKATKEGRSAPTPRRPASRTARTGSAPRRPRRRPRPLPPACATTAATASAARRTKPPPAAS